MDVEAVRNIVARRFPLGAMDTRCFDQQLYNTPNPNHNANANPNPNPNPNPNHNTNPGVPHQASPLPSHT